MWKSFRNRISQKWNLEKSYNHDEVIEADAIVWTAGVRPVKIVREMDAQKDKKGRPLVNQYFQSG